MKPDHVLVFVSGDPWSGKLVSEMMAAGVAYERRDIRTQERNGQRKNLMDLMRSGDRVTPVVFGPAGERIGGYDEALAAIPSMPMLSRALVLA
jgi:hypothetical protein